LLNEIDEEALSKNVTLGPYLDYPPLEKVTKHQTYKKA